MNDKAKLAMKRNARIGHRQVDALTREIGRRDQASPARKLPSVNPAGIDPHRTPLTLTRPRSPGQSGASPHRHQTQKKVVAI